VQKSIENIDAEIIVVDNNSTDGSCDMIKENFPVVKLIQNTENFGFSKGNNIGVSVATGKYVCILNPDTVVPENGFKELLHFAKNKNNLGVIGCHLIDGTGAFLPESKRNIPTPFTALKKILGNDRAYYGRLNEEAIGSVNVLVGAFMLLKTDVYKAVGGFDEDYFMYGEDIDLSYKVIKMGFQNYYYGGVSVIHFKGESTIRDKTYVKRFYGAMKVFYKKHFYYGIVMLFLVNIGIKLMSLKPYKIIVKERKTARIIIVSKLENTKLEQQLKEPLSYSENLENFESNSMVILNTAAMTFQRIINVLKSHKKSQNIMFRIWPEGRNFIIGSDSAIARGEVIKF